MTSREPLLKEMSTGKMRCRFTVLYTRSPKSSTSEICTQAVQGGVGWVWGRLDGWRILPHAYGKGCCQAVAGWHDQAVGRKLAGTVSVVSCRQYGNAGMFVASKQTCCGSACWYMLEDG